MYKKTITYEDYNGSERTEDFYFNLSMAEITEMELSADGGLAETIQHIVAAQDGKQIIAIFKDVILKAYGQKSVDGKRFVKKAPDGHRLADDFAETEAYSKLFMELATDANAASEFVNNVIPKEAQKELPAAPSNITTIGG